MARAVEAADLLQKGSSPSAVASKMGISFASVMQYLYMMVGKGRIRRSDIVFSIPAPHRKAIETILKKSKKKKPALSSIMRSLVRSGLKINVDDVRIYLTLRDHRFSRGELYDDLTDIEITLHGMIRENLRLKHGDRWWREGVPVTIRKECAARREEDSAEPADAYCYTMLFDLINVLDKKWSDFVHKLPRSMKDKAKTLHELKKIASLRNRIMHPVRESTPSDEEFAAVSAFRRSLQDMADLKPNPGIG